MFKPSPYLTEYFRNIGVDATKFSDYAALRDYVSEKKLLYMFRINEAYHNRITNAHSDILAIRAFMFNIFEHLTKK